MAQPLTILFMPESAYGPTNNCVGIGDVLRRRGHRVVFAAEASLERQARAARLRRGPRRPRAAAPARRPGAGRRPVLEGLHPRHGAGVPQADDRAARDVHAPDVAGADRRRPLLRAAAPRDHRPPAARRDRRGQRRRVPGPRDGGRAVRPDRVLQPARDERARRAAGLLRAARGRPIRVGGVPRRSTTGPTDRPGRRSTLGAASRAPRPCRSSSSSTPSSALNLYVYPQVADYTDRRPLDGHVDTGSTRRSARRTPTFELPERARATGRPAPRSSTCRSVRSAAPTST